MNNETFLMPELKDLENVTVTVVDPKGQNEGSVKEKLEQKGYTVKNKNH
ncbi:hypothetical protein [Priestia megaterium]|nr:hypothetical protein [Priestia megaterium]